MTSYTGVFAPRRVAVTWRVILVAATVFAACGRRPSPGAADSAAVDTANRPKKTTGNRSDSGAGSHVADTAPATPLAKAFTPPPPAAARDSTRAYASLTVLSPDSIVLQRGSPSTPTIEVQYTISQPKLVRRAVLQLFDDGARLIDSTVLPVRSEGTGSWELNKPIPTRSAHSQWFEARLILRPTKKGTGAVVRLPAANH